MRKILLLFIILFCCNSYSYSQGPAEYLFHKGMDCYDRGQYQLADSFYLRSLSIEKDKDTYFNLALVKYRLNDVCAYCVNMKEAANMGDKEALDLYNDVCGSRDTIRDVSKDELLSLVKNLSYIVNHTDSCLSSSINYIHSNADSVFASYFVKDEKKIFIQTEKKPEHPDGMRGLMDFLSDAPYPSKAEKKSVVGVVVIAIIVDKDGNVSDMKVEKGLGYGCDDEALRLVKSLPKWKAGELGGMPVNTQINLPVLFGMK